LKKYKFPQKTSLHVAGVDVSRGMSNTATAPKTAKNTAQARSRAWDAEQAGEYQDAAEWLELALALYPPHAANSCLAHDDKAAMTRRARSLRLNA